MKIVKCAIKDSALFKNSIFCSKIHVGLLYMIVHHFLRIVHYFENRRLYLRCHLLDFDLRMHSIVDSALFIFNCELPKNTKT